MPAGGVAEPSRERLLAIDALRGIALLGILMVNIASFKSPAELGIGFRAIGGAADWWMKGLVSALFEGKFYPIFSFLFGLGFALQMARLEARGVSFVPLYLRRMLVLALIGILHAVLIWEGDILLPYAVMGLILLLFRRCSTRALLLWVGMIWLAQFLCCGGTVGLFSLMARIPEARQGFEAGDREMRVSFKKAAEQAYRFYGQGSYGEALRFRLRQWGTLLLVYLAMFPNLLLCFLMGLYCGRVGVFEAPHRYTRWWIGIALAGWLLGLPLNLLYAREVLEQAREASMKGLMTMMWLNLSFGVVLAAGYVATFLLLWERIGRWLTPIACAGRMALTNYLAQSVAGALVFYGYAVGYYGKVGLTTAIAGVVLFYLLQVVISTLWLKRFAYGPMEWVWRSLTYGRRLPLRSERTQQV